MPGEGDWKIFLKNHVLDVFAHAMCLRVIAHGSFNNNFNKSNSNRTNTNNNRSNSDSNNNSSRSNDTNHNTNMNDNQEENFEDVPSMAWEPVREQGWPRLGRLNLEKSGLLLYLPVCLSVFVCLIRCCCFVVVVVVVVALGVIPFYFC